MRTFFAVSFFALAVVLAACGGGGHSGIVPSTTGNGTGPSNGNPSGAKTTRATMMVHIPAPNHQSSRKPLYISSNTKAFGIGAFLESAPPSPSVSDLQIFPVTTPSPCATAVDGSYSCTFSVTAPIGEDFFVVGAFATVSPGPNDVPLSYYISGAVNVAAGASPPALAFTLNGVVNSVKVTVASPDPGNTPNTQVFTAAVATSAPLSVTAYDASGNALLNDPTTPLAGSVIITASPSASGLTLALGSSSQCGSTAATGGAQLSVNCIADLNGITASYDGSTHPDANDHLIDTYTVTGQPPAASLAVSGDLRAREQRYVDDAYAGLRLRRGSAIRHDAERRVLVCGSK